MKTTCYVNNKDIENGQCLEPIYRIFKAQIFNPITGRKSWRTIALCKAHFFEFMKEYQHWETTKTINGEEINLPVIAYKLLD